MVHKLSILFQSDKISNKMSNKILNKISNKMSNKITSATNLLTPTQASASLLQLLLYLACPSVCPSLQLSFFWGVHTSARSQSQEPNFVFKKTKLVTKLRDGALLQFRPSFQLSFLAVSIRQPEANPNRPIEKDLIRPLTN